MRLYDLCVTVERIEGRSVGIRTVEKPAAYEAIARRDCGYDSI
jgi:hypothetical protein